MTVALALLDGGPESREPWMGTPEPAPDFGQPGRLARVLVVDDDAMLRGLLSRMLRESGYDVVLAEDGIEALRCLADDDAIDILVADLRMPRMGGRALGERLRPERPSLPILYISGYVEDWTPHLAAGPATGFLQKPFDEEDLVRSIRALLPER
jgi:two-component system, cell cycle sensor histidine kinase and response regulator CckA